MTYNEAKSTFFWRRNWKLKNAGKLSLEVVLFVWYTVVSVRINVKFKDAFAKAVTRVV